MAKPTRIHQFIPDINNKDIYGAYGWGVDMEHYRMVVYAPKKHDDPAIHKKPELQWFEELAGRSRKTPRHTTQRPSDHGPAHVHVINKKTGKESKFELIQGIDVKDSYALHMPAQDRESKSNLLSHWEQKEAAELLKGRVPEFIQLWEEFFQDKHLRQYVSRVSEKKPDCIEQVLYKRPGVSVRFKDIETGKVVGEMDIASYLARPARPR